jgi:hypothetical protein
MRGIQDVPLAVYDDLAAGDFLFIDSTHVLRTGSDVCRELLDILPRLASGVFVHIHDMFWPFEYPYHWVVEENRSWNELPAVRAFLIGNTDWKVVWFTDYIVRLERPLFEAAHAGMLRNPCGALWLQRVGGLCDWQGYYEMQNEPNSAKKSAIGIFHDARKHGRNDAGGVLLDLNESSGTLVISCSGIVPSRIIYAMEHSSNSINTNRLFICDAKSLWYYEGIEGLSTSFDETVDLVGAIVELVKPAVTCSIGTSGGGYMALALAALLGFDRSLAFSPQTNIGAKWRAENGDPRWADNMSAIHDHLAPHEPYDIREMIQRRMAKSPDGPAVFHVICPSSDALDLAHATRLEHVPGVKVYRVNSSAHNVSEDLHRKDKLTPILEGFIHSDGMDVANKISNILND